MYKLRLYTTGETGMSKALVDGLQSGLKKWLNEECSVEVIDVLENLQKAIDEGILATPTLVRVHPPPIRKIIGDLSDTENVLMELGLMEKQELIGIGID